MLSGDPPGTLSRVIGLPHQPVSSLLHNVRQVSPAHQTEGAVSCQSDPVTSLRLSALVRQPFQGESLTGVQFTERTGRLPPAHFPDPSSPERDRAPGGPGGPPAQGEAGPGYQGGEGGNLQRLPSPRIQQSLLGPCGLFEPEQTTLAGCQSSITIKRRLLRRSVINHHYNLRLMLEVSFSVARSPARALQRLECQE